MQLIIFFFSFILSMSYAETGARKAIVFGGGCEARVNRFIPIMKSQVIGLKKNGWDVQPLFVADDDSEGMKELSVASGKDAKAANKEKLLQELDSVIADKKFKKGGALFISFNTHGEVTPEGGHRVCIGKSRFDLSEPAIEMNLADPEILKRLEILKSRGVKMGFSDMSCYSGESVPVLKEFGCIVSSQNKNLTAMTYGVAGSLGNLLNMPKDQLENKTLSGKLTLEDIYLDAVLNGQNYKPKGSENYNEQSQHATSSLLEKVSPLGETINAMMIIPHPMTHTPYDNKCFYGEKSLDNINNFIDDLNNTVTTNLLENLSGRKKLDLSQLKLDLRNRINERARIRDMYLNFSNKERDYNQSEWKRKNEAAIVASPPEEMMAIRPYLKEALARTFSQEGIEIIEKEDKNINIKIDVMVVKGNKFNKSSSELADDILPMLESALKTDSLKTKGAVPSRQALEKFIGKLISEVDTYISKESIDKKKAQIEEMNFLRNENWKEVWKLKKENPFLEGEKVNQISRDFNLLTAAHYLEQRQKMLNSSKPQKSFTDCAQFDLN